MRALLIVLLLLPALADLRSEALAASQAFEEAGLKARAISEVYPYVTRASVVMLRGLTSEKQSKWLHMLQTVTRMERERGVLPLVDARISGNKATLLFSEKQSKEVLTKEVKLLLEDQVWKVDVTGYTI
ncbi:hypothetical protein DYH09_33580 [bacterium CPR1]|nr:hypothetical protein [bacterium CPR1]